MELHEKALRELCKMATCALASLHPQPRSCLTLRMSALTQILNSNFFLNLVRQNICSHCNFQSIPSLQGKGAQFYPRTFLSRSGGECKSTDFQLGDGKMMLTLLCSSKAATCTRTGLHVWLVKNGVHSCVRLGCGESSCLTSRVHTKGVMQQHATLRRVLRRFSNNKCS